MGLEGNEVKIAIPYRYMGYLKMRVSACVCVQDLSVCAHAT